MNEIWIEKRIYMCKNAVKSLTFNKTTKNKAKNKATNQQFESIKHKSQALCKRKQCHTNKFNFLMYILTYFHLCRLHNFHTSHPRSVVCCVFFILSFAPMICHRLVRWWENAISRRIDENDNVWKSDIDKMDVRT